MTFVVFLAQWFWIHLLGPVFFSRLSAFSQDTKAFFRVRREALPSLPTSSLSWDSQGLSHIAGTACYHQDQLPQVPCDCQGPVRLRIIYISLVHLHLDFVAVSVSFRISSLVMPCWVGNLSLYLDKFLKSSLS